MMTDMFTIDVVAERKAMQAENYDKALEILNGFYSEKEIRKKINDKALDRALEYLSMSLPELLGACSSNPVVLKLAAMQVSVCSSRQGAILEGKILNGVSDYLSQFGVDIRQAKNNKELRPMKSGGALTSTEFAKLGKSLKKDALKSIDGFVSAPFSGYIFAKVRTGVGGHQDNVDTEAHNFIEWALNEPNDKVYILLIDGDRNDLLYARETDNIWVCNHVEFQERMIEYVGQ
jgi:hypothetical protein